MPLMDIDRGFESRVTHADRRRLMGHPPFVLWFTGLSGSGKSTIADAVEYRLVTEFQTHCYNLDGDIIRAGLNKDLDFSLAGREENIRRIGEVCRLFYDAGLITLTAFISPLRADRDTVRALLPPGGFIEIYLNCPLEVCEQRDPKGLYRKARAGQIRSFTGIDSPYEAPTSPELVLDTSTASVDNCVEAVLQYLQTQQLRK
jgi:adenylylsulfate kinase